MDLDDLLGPKPSIIDLRAEDRWEAIDELVNHLAANHRIQAEHKDAIAESVRRRESSMTTGIGFGIGLPHASTDLVSDVVAAAGRSRNGIQFDAVDEKPVNVVILFLLPRDGFQKHLDTMANLAKLLHRKDFRDGLWRRVE